MSFRISGLHGPVGNELTVSVFLRQNKNAPPGFAMKTFRQVLENPELRPEEKRLDEFGLTIPVAGLPDLVRMKLNSFRPKDETHLETLDQCGLITPELEAALPEVLRERLAQARSRFSPDEFET
ncbi:MAG: hypothetical protein K2X35_24500 [Bryobacteraceae bacterium]|nr:hypothetical protein [Bryobacteraceae bacterium]